MITIWLWSLRFIYLQSVNLLDQTILFIRGILEITTNPHFQLYALYFSLDFSCSLLFCLCTLLSIESNTNMYSIECEVSKIRKICDLREFDVLCNGKGYHNFQYVLIRTDLFEIQLELESANEKLMSDMRSNTTKSINKSRNEILEKQMETRNEILTKHNDINDRLIKLERPSGKNIFLPLSFHPSFMYKTYYNSSVFATIMNFQIHFLSLLPIHLVNSWRQWRTLLRPFY